MSSFTRRIQRQVSPSNAGFWSGPKSARVFVRYEARRKFFNGRGSKLGVHNPKDVALLARLAREAKRKGVE